MAGQSPAGMDSMHSRNAGVRVPPAASTSSTTSSSALQDDLRDVFRSAPSTTQRRNGRIQHWTVRDILRGTLAPCLSLEHAMTSIRLRSETREQAEYGFHIPWTMESHYARDLDAQFGARPVDFFAAHREEQRAQGVTDLLQWDAANGTSPGACQALCIALREEIALKKRALEATELRLAELTARVVQ
jgi:hypothetical protein